MSSLIREHTSSMVAIPALHIFNDSLKGEFSKGYNNHCYYY